MKPRIAPIAQIEKTAENTLSLIRDLRGTRCRGCGKNKKPGHSFCFRCYVALPGEIQQHLYLRLGQGYEAAFVQAEGFLKSADKGVCHVSETIR